MEDNGLIDGRWVEKAGQRRRRYYRLTAAGTKTLARQRGLWEQFVNGLERVARFRPRRTLGLRDSHELERADP